MIQIGQRILDAVYRHALASIPTECCGIIIGKKEAKTIPGQLPHLDRVFPCRNVQAVRHKENPEKYPRTSETAYLLDPDDLFRIQKIARQSGMAIKIIYHSHVNVGAYFSGEDKQQALADGVPLYPGVYYFVVDAAKEKIRGAKLFGWNSGEKDFEEIAWRCRE